MMIETHKSFVNAWECDENDHLNVQFYFKRFSEAGEIFALLNDQNRRSGHLPLSRHVRYHKELRNNASTITKSAVIADGDYAGCVVHLMKNTITGDLSATALDTVEYETRGLTTVSAEEVSIAFPKGVAHGPQGEFDFDALDKDQSMITHWRVVQPAECDHNGLLTTQNHIAQFTDGAPHIWDHTGLTTQWLSENGYGRVAVEMKLTPLAPIKTGAVTRQKTFVPRISSKTFTIIHQIEEVETGKALAIGEVVGLVMDLTERRAVSMPEFLQKA